MFKKFYELCQSVEDIRLKIGILFSEKNKQIQSVDLMRVILGSINVFDIKAEPELLQERKEFINRIEVGWKDIDKVLDCMINQQADINAHTDPTTLLTGFPHGTLNGIELVKEKLRGYHLESVQNRTVERPMSTIPGMQSLNVSPFPVNTSSPNEKVV